MKISELLVESQQLDEGPILNKIGSAVGKGVGAVAKGVGAVAGGVAGLGTAVKKGFQAGKATVGGADDSVEPATADKRNILQKVRDTMPGSKPTTDTTTAGGGGTAQDAPVADTGSGTAQVTQAPPAQKKPTSAFGKLSAAAAGQTAADPTAAGGGSQYAQVKANIDKLDKKGKQRILGLLQKEVGAAPATPKPTPAKPTAGSSAEPAADAGAGAMGAMAGQLAKGGAAEPNTMANAPVSKTNKAKSGNPNQATIDADRDRIMGQPDKVTADPAAAPKARGGRKAGAGPSMTPDAIRKRASREANAAKQQATEPKKKPAAPSQAEMDADRERIMGVTSDSVIRTRPMMAEGFSLFRKR